MHWAYVAGFFDGEGCVRHQNDKSASQVTIVQSTRQDKVLFEIQKFLISEGIRANLHVAKGFWGKHGDGSVRGLRSLSVGESSSLVKFFENVIPHLIVKREKAIEALERARRVRKRRADSLEHIGECIEHYQSGLSQAVVSKKYNISRTTLVKHLKLKGITPRSREFEVKAYFHRRRHSVGTTGSSRASACSS